MAKITKDIKEKLGSEKLEEIAEKEWNVADLPSEEDLSKEKHKSPKARSNPNSRKNLAQYNKNLNKDSKKKILNNLKFTHKEEDVNLDDIFDEGVDYSVFEKIWPALDVLVDRKEQEIYYNTLNLFVRDFDINELTFSDYEDMITLATNQVLIFRLMKGSRANPKLVLEMSAAVEKFRRQSEKIKSGLASRRVDRIDVKHKASFSIVDLAAQADKNEADRFKRRIEELKREEEEYEAADLKE